MQTTCSGPLRALPFRSLLAFLGLVAAVGSVAAPATQAQSGGRVKWRYRVQSAYIPVRPVILPDGNVYAIDVDGTLHALAADGTLRWTLPGAGRNGLDVARDGTVYVGDGSKIVAVDPSGTVRWTHRFAPGAVTLHGPNVGPDGNIYAVAPDGPGIVSLTPAGALRWSTPERRRRPMVTSQEIVFRLDARGRDLRMLFSGHGHLAEVDTSNGRVTDLASGGDNQPAVGPNGDVYSTASHELRAIAPDGTLRWIFRSTTLDGLSDPTAGTDGVVYVVRMYNDLHALRPSDGTSLWEYSDLSSLRDPIASPTNRMILVTGRTRGFTDFVRAVDPQGSLMWQVDLPREGGGGVFPMTPARFAADGNTAVLGTMVNNSYCYVYAFDTSPGDRADVWTWGRACRGISTLLPVLGFTGQPVLGSGFSVDLSDARANTNVAHLIGTEQVRVSFHWDGAPECTIYARPDLVLPLRSDGQGRATTPLIVPNVPALAGLTLFHQFLVSDPVNRRGIVATTGGASLLGF